KVTDFRETRSGPFPIPTIGASPNSHPGGNAEPNPGKTPGAKLQIPKSKLQKNPKLQAPMGAWGWENDSRRIGLGGTCRSRGRDVPESHSSRALSSLRKHSTQRTTD